MESLLDRLEGDVRLTVPSVEVTAARDSKVSNGLAEVICFDHCFANRIRIGTRSTSTGQIGDFLNRGRRSGPRRLRSRCGE